MKRWLSWILALCLLMTALPMAVSAASVTYDFTALDGFVKTQGRVERAGNALYMDTSGSGFELYFYGAGDVSLNTTVKCTYTGNMFLTVVVDGVKSRVEIASTNNVAATKTVTLASGLQNGYHHIEVYKQTEASSALMAANSVTLDGTLMIAPPEDKITIEVVGDSISGGASNLATNSTANASYPVYQDGTQTYAYLTGEALSANVRVTQTSGFGCCGGWNAQGKDLNLQDMFPYTSYWRNHTNAGLYAFQPAADIVVINLGTNDASAAKYGKINLTAAEFKAGAKNLMTMARQKNPGAKIVWVTGMMGITYQSELTAAVSELGGASSGYFFTILPENTAGGEGHPTVAGHKAAAESLTAFLLANCLPAGYKADFATADTLQATLDTAKATANPSAALTSAIALAEAEIDTNATDGYRLGCRVKALKDAMNGYVTGLSLMPTEGVTEAPNTNGHFIWPYYGNPEAVTLYKGGEGVYWPYLHTEYAAVVDLDDTPFLTLDTSGTAEWNVHIAYKDKNGNHVTVTATDVAGGGLVNFPVNGVRGTMSLDFGAYVKAMGHADSEGRVTIVGCDLYVVGATDTFVTFHTCALTSALPDGAPSKITGGSFTLANGILSGVALDTTAAYVIEAMDNSEYLRVVDANGQAVTGVVGTGMKLQLVVDGTVKDECVLAVYGDINGDGAMSSVDAREMLLVSLGLTDATAAEKAAVDMDFSGELSTNDVRIVLRRMLA